MFRSGFITIIGRPNVGKSTLLNRIIGEKISIVSNKPQTTRNRIQLIHTEDRMQIVFIDTPGIQKPKNALGEYMLKISTSSWEDMDLILYMSDCSTETGPLEEMILSAVENINTPVILVLNKIDTASKEEIIKAIEMFSQRREFEAIIPISAIDGSGVDTLMDEIYNVLPEGPMYYPEDMITDQPERFIIGEIIREKALQLLSEEVPHGIYVEVESVKSIPNTDRVEVGAVIYCERESHKGIVIGKGGKMLKEIGTRSREDINRLLGTKTHLELWVKVEKNWRDRQQKIRNFGYQ
ncbi:MAG: GTPase Era [Tissierellia bacterium]|nr:GTPase Era [Tissierellia bacterium]